MRGIRAAPTALSLCLCLGLTTPGAAPVASASAGHAPPRPRIASFFGAAPRNCPIASPRLIHHHRGVIWVGSVAFRANSGWYVTNHRLSLTFGARTKYGYPQKIFWQLPVRARKAVTLRGWNLKTGQRIWFGRPRRTPNPQSMVRPPVIAWTGGIVRP